MKPDAPRIAAERGQAQAESNANPEWLDFAYEALVTVASEKRELTTDDVWAKLETWEKEGIRLPATPTNSAIGPVVVRAISANVITFAGKMQKSVRTERHGNPLRVWTSRLYQEEGK